MITYPIFPNAKIAHVAGFKIFTSEQECKYNHNRKLRRVMFQNGTYTSKCLDCEQNARTKYLNDPENQKSTAESKRLWKSKNRHRQNEWREKLKETKPFNQQLTSIRQRCTKLGIPFDLDEEYIETIIPKDYICPILDLKMFHGKRGTDRNFWISIDRLNPHGGYVKGNVAIISAYANALKRNCTDPTIFRRIAIYIENGGPLFSRPTI